MNKMEIKMNKKIIGLLSTFLLILAFISLGFRGDDKNGKVKKTSINDDYEYIAINQILMWVSNNGDGSHDPRTDGNGFYWPGGINNTGKSAIFEDGLIFAGKVGREIRMNGNTHRQGLQAGKILPSGEADNPGLEKYRVYKIRKGWESLPPGPDRDSYEKDYNEWPMEDGAPYVDVNGDGVPSAGDEPFFVGDEVLWYVANDLDASRSTFTYGTLPFGLEFQTTIFGFQRTGALGDMVFKKYKIINKGSNVIREMILGYWSDTDLGDANDDLTGCDTVLSLGYTYNGTNSDGIYGSPPPAVGYDFFQGPIVPAAPADSAKFDGKWIKGYKNLPMTAFTFYTQRFPRYRDPTQGVASGSIEFYNYLSGKVWDGTPFIDPNTGQIVKIILAGDPVTGTGWNDYWSGGPSPGDRRHVMGSGPFTMAPGDTQEVVVGIVIAKGTSNLNSITELKRKDVAAQIAYDLDFQLTPSPPSPKLHAFSDDKKVTLWWENNAESYDEGDPLIYNAGLADTTYTFQGYRLWQFKDQAGTEPVLLAVYDIKDTIAVISDYVTINGKEVLVPVITGPNEGLTRFLQITKDAYSNGALYNGSPYYFSVTAYGYSGNSSPTFLENPPVIIEVRPGTRAIDEKYGDEQWTNSTGKQVAGTGEGKIIWSIVDPTALTGDTYRVNIHGGIYDPSWDIINVTKGDTIIRNVKNFGSDTLYNKYVVDGLMIKVINIGADSLKKASTGFYEGKIKRVVEIANENGTLSEPVDVVMGLNSTGKWRITGYQDTTGNVLTTLNVSRDITPAPIGFTNYELRFSGSSEYYLTGSIGVSEPRYLKSDSLAPDKVPFEFWNVGKDIASDTDNVRLSIKVRDVEKGDITWTTTDHTWTRRANGEWEPLYFSTLPPYVEPMPIKSGNLNKKDFVVGNFVIAGEKPATGTIIRIETWKPLSKGDVFEFKVPKTERSNTELAKNNIDNISVFPNPYFGANSLERDKYQRFVRFTNMPQKVTVRIFALSGVFINTIEKNDTSPYLDWNLRNSEGLPVASGVYIAYLDIPNVGTKVMKLAVIMETQYIDRL